MVAGSNPAAPTIKMEKDQIIIIGGGIIGLATANALLDRGEKVLVLEKNSDTATEASFANAGMLTPVSYTHLTLPTIYSV